MLWLPIGTIAALVVGCIPAYAQAELVADRFQIEHELDGDLLRLSLDTDLPDYAVVLVRVSRAYRQSGEDDLYSKAYFSEKSTIGDWRSIRSIRLDHRAWRSALQELQATMARVGEPFTVIWTDERIEISAMVPVNQADARFGKRNENLRGRAVSTTGLRVVQAEEYIHFPIAESKMAPTRFAAPQGLKAGVVYLLSKSVPLMSHYNPSDPLAALAKTRRLPARSRIDRRV